MAIARRAVDQHTVGRQMRAGGVDVIDLIGQMAEMTAVRRQARIAIPVVGQLYRAVRLTGRGHENQGETALVVLIALGFFQPQQAIEGHGFLKIQNPDHGVQIADCHSAPLF